MDEKPWPCGLLKKLLQPQPVMPCGHDQGFWNKKIANQHWVTWIRSEKPWPCGLLKKLFQPQPMMLVCMIKISETNNKLHTKMSEPYQAGLHCSNWAMLLMMGHSIFENFRVYTHLLIYTNHVCWLFADKQSYQWCNTYKLKSSCTLCLKQSSLCKKHSTLLWIQKCCCHSLHSQS